MGVRGRENGFDSLVKPLYRTVVKKKIRAFQSFFNAEMAEATERTQRTAPLRVAANGNMASRKAAKVPRTAVLGVTANGNRATGGRLARRLRAPCA